MQSSWLALPHSLTCGRAPLQLQLSAPEAAVGIAVPLRGDGDDEEEECGLHDGRPPQLLLLGAQQQAVHVSVRAQPVQEEQQQRRHGGQGHGSEEQHAVPMSRGGAVSARVLRHDEAGHGVGLQALTQALTHGSERQRRSTTTTPPGVVPCRMTTRTSAASHRALIGTLQDGLYTAKAQ